MPVAVLGVDDGRLVVTAGGDVRGRARSTPIEPGRWYRVDARRRASTACERGRHGGARAARRGATCWSRTAGRRRRPVAGGWDGTIGRILLGRGTDGWHFDGRLGGSALDVDGHPARGTCRGECTPARIVEVTGLGPDGELHQLPARGVTGPRWDGSVQAWTADPSHYDAVHFHTDDLYDAGWDATATRRPALPTCRAGSTPSGVRAPHGEDRVPFFVRPAAGAPTADVALLMPTCTYIAYANHRQLIDGADFIARPHPAAARARVRADATPRSVGRTTRSTPTAAA